MRLNKCVAVIFHHLIFRIAVIDMYVSAPSRPSENPINVVFLSGYSCGIQESFMLGPLLSSGYSSAFRVSSNAVPCELHGDLHA